MSFHETKLRQWVGFEVSLIYVLSRRHVAAVKHPRSYDRFWMNQQVEDDEKSRLKRTQTAATYRRLFRIDDISSALVMLRLRSRKQSKRFLPRHSCRRKMAAFGSEMRRVEPRQNHRATSQLMQTSRESNILRTASAINAEVAKKLSDKIHHDEKQYEILLRWSCCFWRVNVASIWQPTSVYFHLQFII